VVESKEPRPLGLFGFTRSQLPANAEFTSAPIREVSPPSFVFRLSTGSGPIGSYGLGIDREGQVIKFAERPRRPAEYHALGRVSRAKLEAMATLAATIEPKHTSFGAACGACGLASLEFHPEKGPADQWILIASDGTSRKRVMSAEADQVVLWLLAVKKQAGYRLWTE